MLKRLLALCLTGFVGTAVASLQPYIPVPKTVDQATYLSVNVGPYIRDVQDDSLMGSVLSSVADTESWRHSNAGMQVGLTAGWQIKPYLSIEATWTWYENQSVTVASFSTGNDNYLNNSYELGAWSIEGALVYQHQVMHDTELFAKAGAAYVGVDLNNTLYDTTETANVSTHTRYGYWTPMFGAGVRFFFTDNWYGLCQYTIYFSGGKDVTDGTYAGAVTRYSRLHMPITQRVGLSVGYRIEL